MKSVLSVLAILGFAVFNASAQASQSIEAGKTVSAPGTTNSTNGKEFIEGKVISIESGDAITVESSGRKYSVKLQSIDAPDNGQSYFESSRKTLSKLINKKDVRIVVLGRDPGESLTGTVYYDGRDIGLRLLEKGMAWYSKRSAEVQTAVVRKSYSDAQAYASSAGVGLWTEDDPVPPWVFRGEELTPAAKASEKENAQATQPSDPLPPLTDDGHKYVLGPRGGCYYIADSGRRVYVKDKRRCSVSTAEFKP